MPERMRQCVVGMAIVALAGLAGPTPTLARVQGPRSPACRDSVWGCGTAVDTEGNDSSEPPRQRYDRLLAQARRALAGWRSSSPSLLGELGKDTAQKLSDAAALLPDDYEAPSLLGQLELERGRLVAAGLLLRRAEELYLHPKPDRSPQGATLPGLAAAVPLEHRDPALALALALLHAQEGDLVTALRRYQRLYEEAAHSPRLLYRLADVLMAQGRLEDATALFVEACNLPRSLEIAAVDVARACLGAVVALDRAGRSVPGPLLRRARQADRGPRATELSDFLTTGERDYGRALLLAPGCERKLLLQSYLRTAAGLAPATYSQRAEAHLGRLRDLICTPPASPSGSPSASPGPGSRPVEGPPTVSPLRSL